MADANATSAEQLDALFEAGTISQEEYEVLREAMAKQPAREPLEESGTKPWGRSMAHGVFGGVCAGIAQRVDMDIWAVRLLFALAAVATGGTAALAYIGLSIALPQLDEGEPGEKRFRFPWGSSIAVVIGWLLVFIMFSYYIPHVAVVFEHYEAALPASTQWVIQIRDVLFSSGSFIPFYILVPTCLIILLAALPADKPARGVIVGLSLLAFLLLVGGTVIALHLPIYQLAERIESSPPGTGIPISPGALIVSVLFLILICLGTAFVVLPPKSRARRVVLWLAVLGAIGIVLTLA